ncbi:MAG TPA: 30S ribosome-binding factor RbfA [Tepidisphaeraceae bacterium]|jgi:ribosome-binding factor A
MSRRTERLSSFIQQELALIIMRELSDPRLTGLPTITRVSVSEDLSMADIYVTSMGTPGQQAAALNALKHSAGMMRTKLTKMLSIRQVPFLRFHPDEQLKKEMAVLELIDKAKRESEEREQRRLAAGGGSDTSSPGAADTEPTAAEHAVADQSLPGESPGAEQL